MPVEKDWAGLPEAPPIIIAAAQRDEPGQRGLHLFFGDDGHLIGNGGWKASVEWRRRTGLCRRA
ncbi:MAG TPA: hypothetical protein VGD83_10090, partial [Streptosporangiaceae bacterium]